MIITGYHGTSRDRADRLVADPHNYPMSANPGDWLGRGLYFWQDAPQRAIVWAKRNGLEDSLIGVVKAQIDLDKCLDLFDLQTYRELRSIYPKFIDHERRSGFSWAQDGLRVQSGIAYTGTSPTAARADINNLRDRALIDWYVEFLHTTESIIIKSVRGIFLYGRAIFPESFLFDWSHSQISVIDRTAIIHVEHWSRP